MHAIFRLTVDFAGNKSHHVLPPLASIANEVLLTSVGNVGLWAHKARQNSEPPLLRAEAHCALYLRVAGEQHLHLQPS
jgi:hypothetical protein